jgi:hypothetical protein
LMKAHILSSVPLDFLSFLNDDIVQVRHHDPLTPAMWLSTLWRSGTRGSRLPSDFSPRRDSLLQRLPSAPAPGYPCCG